jgi:general secretion pathway protein C
MFDAFDTDLSGRRATLLARLALTLALAAAAFALLRLLLLAAVGPSLPATAPVASLPELPTASGDAAQSVAAWHLFGNASGPIDLAALAQAAPATALQLTLRGTLNENAPEGGVAIIADPSGADRAYRVGDTLPGDARLEGIYAGRVLLSRNGVNESLSLPREATATTGGATLPGAAPAAGTAPPRMDPRNPIAPFIAPRIAPGAPSLETLRDAAGTNIAELARQVQIYPVMENGRMAGVRLGVGRDSDLLARAGLQANDVITSVNGIPLDGPQRSAELMTALKDARSVQVTVRRDGKDIQLTLGL